MRKLPLFLCLTLLVSGGAAMALTVDEAIALFQGSDIMIPYSDEGRATLEEAIAAFRDALAVTDALDEANEDAVKDFVVDVALLDVVNKLSQCYYTLADAFLEGEDNERPTYQRGKHWGLKALRMDETFAATEAADGFVAAVGTSENVDGLYWAAANWLRAAEFNPLEAVFAGVPEKTDTVNRRCLDLDETYMNYGSYRALGAFWSGLPKLPAGNYRKNWSRSLGYFCHIVNEPDICAEWDCDVCPELGEFNPLHDEYFENRLLFVQYYLLEKGGYEDEAKRILEAVLALPIGDRYPLYNAISQEKAAAFLADLE
ncbi:TRAP transporter TatT component family protein [Candidatus Bipolaricaulota bacterium]